MRLALALIASFFAVPALADYSDHRGVTLFTEKPCTEAVGTIDGSMARGDLDSTVRNIAAHGMAWGFILGFDTAHGGLEGDEETTLIRLRKACAETPDATAMELLRGFR